MIAFAELWGSIGEPVGWRNKMKKITVLGLIGLTIMSVVCTGCGSTNPADAPEPSDPMMIHVSVSGSDATGDGTENNPYETITCAAAKVQPGSRVIIHEGEYEPLELDDKVSGTSEKPVSFEAADGEKAVIVQETGNCQSGEDGMKDAYGIHIVNASNITIRGLEVKGGTHGIYYESTRKQCEKPLENISIIDCRVHDVCGAHGICVYARNDLTPVEKLTMKNCRIYDCKCGDSESAVFNGNIDGFEICGNVIHDNNNIGIDMIGFEGNAKHPKNEDFDNPYSVDFVRNGTCHDNIVYNISAEGNPAYEEDGEYDLCADGIYVDGAQDIEIYNNFVFNCNIGLEVATEHSPDDNELFRVSGIHVHDNVLAGCRDWCGLCFGGYDRDLGFTENCDFNNNTFVDNETQLGIQRSKNNKIYDNLFVGKSSAIEFNYDCRQKDLINDIGRNVWCIAKGDLEEYIDCGDYDMQVLMPEASMLQQDVIHKRKEVINGFASRIEGVGSSFIPDESYVKIYKEKK